MSNKFYVSTDTITANQPNLFVESSFKALTVAADVLVRCAICEEHVSLNSTDYRALGVFICDKCKAAVKHVRKLLEDGGSTV